MAKNLRAQIPNDDKLLVFDRDREASSKFVQEVGIAATSVGAESKGTIIEVVNSPREVAENSVSMAFSYGVSGDCAVPVMSLFYR